MSGFTAPPPSQPQGYNDTRTLLWTVQDALLKNWINFQLAMLSENAETEQMSLLTWIMNACTDISAKHITQSLRERYRPYIKNEAPV